MNLGITATTNSFILNDNMNNKYRIFNPEVLYSKEALTTINKPEIHNLTYLSSKNLRKRIRLCAHPNQNDSLHEMFIVHQRGAYVRPHKHIGKSESTHIIQGLVDVVLFDNDGQIVNVINMGDYSSGKIFYYRMETPIFHTLIIRSKVLVFHETTNGPFDRSTSVFAPWAPEDNDTINVVTFMSDLNNKIYGKKNA